MTIFVLDNSVTMRWCFDGGTHAKADAFLQDLTTAGSQAIVPILWRYEVSSVLARAEIAGQLTTDRANEFLDILDTLPIAIDDDAGRRVLTDVHRLAVTYRLTSYDAAYLELALRRNLALATFDAELIAASKSAGVTIL